MLAWASWGALWALGQKVTFDGENKLVIVDPSVTTINFKNDVYSAWKEWIRLYDHAEFLQALRTTGGDPLTGSQILGDYYFFINGWRMVIDHGMSVEGNVFSDDYPSPFIAIGSAQLVTNVVSSLTTQVDSGNITATQELMLLEIYRLLGLDPTRPLVVSTTSRTALPEISQTIASSGGPNDPVTITRNP